MSNKLRDHVKVLCRECYEKRTIGEWRPSKTWKELDEIIENSKTCENCGCVFKNDSEKIAVFFC